MNDERKSFDFIFNDNRKTTLPLKQVLNISSSFYNKNFNNNESKINIYIPNNISYETFKEFIKIVKEQNNNENKLIIRKDIDIIQLIQLSEFFENDITSIYLISEYILYEDIKINKNNAYILLLLSFNKLNKLNVNDKYSNEEDIENVWLDLFLKTLEIVGKNLLFFFEDEKLDIFDKKIIDELFEKYFMNLISYNYLINIGENIIENNQMDKIKENINENNNDNIDKKLINNERSKENSFDNKLNNNENKKENNINNFKKND